jgi:hypothetical protein
VNVQDSEELSIDSNDRFLTPGIVDSIASVASLICALHKQNDIDADVKR